MHRSDIINSYIKKYNYKSYLEIGGGNGETFNQITIDNKICIDIKIHSDDFKSTEIINSDDFFKNCNNKYDIIFIDGDHWHTQVENDLNNSLLHLNNNGTVIMHDCNPEIENDQGWIGAPQGTVWKTFLKFRLNRNDLEMFTIDTDCGCGIIRYGKQELYKYNTYENCFMWSHFNKNKKEILNLKSINEFINIVGKDFVNISEKFKNIIDYSKHNDEPKDFKDGCVIQDFLEYSSLSINEILDNINNYKINSANDFNKYNKDENEFYKLNNSYIFDLLSGSWNLVGQANKINKFIPNCMKTIKEHPGNKFMEFGGGVGVFCQMIKEYTNKNVTYVDLKNKISDFAIWRYKKYNININIELIEQDEFDIKNSYDIIFTDAVWEHLNNEKQEVYLYKLLNILNNNGLFVFLVDLSGYIEDMPYHHNVDIVKLHEILNKECVCLYGLNTFASIWRKK